jgi:acetyl esterase/lipase
MKMKRTKMGFGGAALLAIALITGSAQAKDNGPALPHPPPLTEADHAKLAPIAPELREAGRMAIYFSSLMGNINEEVVLASRKTGGGPIPAPHLDDVSVKEEMVAVGTGHPPVKLFIINAKAGTKRPGIIHTHGGGYILGTAETDVRRLQEMARDLDAVIISVEYRLAPETTYAGSIEDNYAGLRYIHTNADKLGVDRERVAVTGESAGGGHAALLALTARERGEYKVAFQALVYPMLDDRTGGKVQVPAHIATVGWSASENQYGWKAFLGQEPGTDSVPVRAVPARTENLKDLPPTFIAVGGLDLFAGENIEYARRLNEAGVPTELLVIPGAFHGFDQIAPDAPQSKQFTNGKVEALRRAFAATAK